jgi:dTDP-4-amino-4,6-dideoxygalactose transaminase
MPEIMELAESKDLVVIEDACQAHGAEVEDKRAGSHADMAAFSFYPSKILNTTGDGGIVVTSNDDYAERLERFVNHGRKSQYEYSEFGFNWRIARTYDNTLEDIAGIESPEEPKAYRHVYYLYTVLAEKRDLLLDFLKKKQIGASVEYPVVLHELDYVASLDPGLPPEGLQVSESCLRRICALPMFSTITEEQLDYVSEAIHTFYRESN